MPLRKRKEPRDSQHYARGSTKKRTRRKRFIRPWQILVPSLCALAGIVLALVLGNYLQAKSDAYRENEGESDWLSPAERWNPFPYLFLTSTPSASAPRATWETFSWRASMVA